VWRQPGRGAVWRRWGRPVVASMILAVSAASAQVGDDTRHDPQTFAGTGVQGCLICHGENAPMPAVGILQTPHAVIGNPRAPLADAHACETCHGPSDAHLSVVGGRRPPPAVAFSAQESASDKDAMCLGCHQREAGVHWATSIHSFEEVACADCHVAHAPSDPVLMAERQAGVCYQCHERTRAEFFRRSAHPVGAALMQCTHCHAPHGSAGPALLGRETINQSCYDCHAEMRGPFLWEHAPVREDCTNCHVPHGSNHPSLLQARTPWLCQQCHLAQFHPSTISSGMDVPPRGASHLLLSQNCMNCHSQVHGTNHPSGPGLTR
jgi:DmsE family decaheme c-type cytochrome